LRIQPVLLAIAIIVILMAPVYATLSDEWRGSPYYYIGPVLDENGSVSNVEMPTGGFFTFPYHMEDNNTTDINETRMTNIDVSHIGIDFSAMPVPVTSTGPVNIALMNMDQQDFQISVFTLHHFNTS
jgi:hypothetical protein